MNTPHGATRTPTSSLTTRNPKQTEAGMKFAKWMSDHNFEWSRDSGHMPVRKSILDSSEFKALENWQAFAKSLPGAHYYPAIVKQAEVFGREPTSPFVIMMESVMLDQAQWQTLSLWLNRW